MRVKLPHTVQGAVFFLILSSDIADMQADLCCVSVLDSVFSEQV